MPNWMQNAITVEGKDADKVIKQILVEDKEDSSLRFDFNNLIPMPKTLNMISGSITKDLMNLYVNSIKSDSEQFVKYHKLMSKSRYCSYSELTENKVNQLIKDYLGYLDKDMDVELKTKEDILAYGKQYLDNIDNYGSENWYEWSCRNWGTKWNACETLYSEDNPCYVMFQTAWDNVPEILVALSKKFPENTFYYEYAEEQYGNYCGYMTFKNGEAIEYCPYQNESKEAYEMSFKLWGQPLCFKYNEETKTYEYIEDESEDDEDAEL